MILKSPDPPTNPDVFQETVNGLQRSPKPVVGGASGLTTQSPPRSPSPNPRSSSPKKQSKAMPHTGIIPLASHLITARRVQRHLNKSLTLTAHTVPSSSSSSVRSSSSGRFYVGILLLIFSGCLFYNSIELKVISLKILHVNLNDRFIRIFKSVSGSKT